MIIVKTKINNSNYKKLRFMMLIAKIKILQFFFFTMIIKKINTNNDNYKKLSTRLTMMITKKN